MKLNDCRPSMIQDVNRFRVNRVLHTGAAVCVFCFSIIGGTAHDSLAATVDLPTRTVALSDRIAPHTDGATFSGFDDPAINFEGQTAFGASLTLGGNVNMLNDTGTWSEGSGVLELIAREGFTAPGTENAKFSDFVPPSFEFNTSPGINSAGQTMFRRFLQTDGSVNSSNDVGIWSGGAGGLELVAREGSLAPDSAGVTFGGGTGGYPFLEDPVFNDVGQTAFRGLLQIGNGVTSSNDLGIWSEGSGTLTLLAREDSAAPGTGGARFSQLQRPAINGAGKTAFRSTLKISGSVDNSNDTGIWSDASGSLALVIRERALAPGTDGERFGDFVQFFIQNHTVINGAGQIAFRGLLQGADSDRDSGIWSEGSGQLALVAREGDAAPGTEGARYGGFNPPVINGSGRTAFGAILRTDDFVNGSNDSGIWSEGSGSLKLVAREGELVPGTTDTYFGDFGFSRPVMNGAGQTAFLTLLQAGGRCIWAEDASLVLRRVACEGDLLEVADGDFRTISSLGFVGDSGNEDGRRSGFSDLGQLAFHATFTDSSSGVFVTTVPEPPTSALSCTVLLVLLPWLLRKKRSVSLSTLFP